MSKIADFKGIQILLLAVQMTVALKKEIVSKLLTTFLML